MWLKKCLKNYDSSKSRLIKKLLFFSREITNIKIHVKVIFGLFLFACFYFLYCYAILMSTMRERENDQENKDFWKKTRR